VSHIRSPATNPGPTKAVWIILSPLGGNGRLARDRPLRSVPQVLAAYDAHDVHRVFVAQAADRDGAERMACKMMEEYDADRFR